MAKKKKKKQPEEEEQSPGVHKELSGFDIKINEFGEITTSFDVDRVNEFLNDKVEDKKLKGRKDKGEEEE
jgi:hypothetical protein